jgi:hypothetical protein
MRKTRLLALSLTLLLPASAVLASNPPKNTGKAKPPVWVNPPIEWFDKVPAKPDPNAKADALIAAGYGSSVMQPQKKRANLAPAALSEFSTQVALAGSRRFKFSTVPLDVSGGWPRTLYTWNYQTTDFGETEPSIVSNDIAGVTYHVAAFHRPAIVNGLFDNWINANYSTNLTPSSFSASAPFRLYVPSGYAASSDPWLVANSFSDGIAPRRIYTTGITFNRDANGYGISPSAIRAWYSNNGGQTWSGGWPIDTRAAGQPLLDRPTATVSDYSGTRGYFYSAYTEFSNPMRLWITSSTNGVTPFCNAVAPIHCIPPQLTTTLVSDREGPFGPAIVVNPTTGRLYVFWWTQTTPFGNAAIRMRRSSDWSAANFEVDGSGNAIEYTIANGYTSAGNLPNGVRALTTVSAKYNSYTGRVDLAWHGSKAGTNGTAIYYMSVDPDAVSSFNTPMGYSTVDASGDQYDPVLDSDDNGWTFVSYLSNENSVNGNGQLDNYRYQHYGFAVAPSGILYSPSPLETGTHFPFWPGDYHGNYYWTALDSDGARWNVVDAISNPDRDPMDIRWTGVK